MIDPSFIASHAELAHACEVWSGLDAVGLDTEFERTRTYYSRPALVQLFDGEHVSLIDPLAIDDFAPLAELLGNAGVTKVMHAAEADMEVLEQLTGATPASIFDTQLAAAFTGHGFSLGYRHLVQTLLDEGLAKDETRSDWLRRPLSDAQISYAALDVLYLLPMYRRLRCELERLGRMEWFMEETERLQRRRTADRDPRRAYLRIREGRRLEGDALKGLRELAAWREEEARSRDRPRQMILSDASLAAIAAAMPADVEAIAALGVLSGKALRRYGDVLVARVGAARAAEAVPAPARGLERRHAAWLKTLKQVLRRRSETLAIPAPLLAQSRTLEGLVASVAAGDRALPEELHGWRESAIGEPLMAALEGLGEESS